MPADMSIFDAGGVYHALTAPRIVRAAIADHLADPTFGIHRPVLDSGWVHQPNIYTEQ
ncbi:hypothetical protein sphantq_04513 (plasmid) [Sphingobium sp. AntQ-1]|nr:hypothetical protein sphantq_04513 [Sphingobium sp. AntQ-1]